MYRGIAKNWPLFGISVIVGLNYYHVLITVGSTRGSGSMDVRHPCTMPHVTVSAGNSIRNMYSCCFNNPGIGST